MTHPRFGLLDWRRQVAQLYAEVRGAPRPAEAHRRWVDGRTRLLLEHAQSPIPVAERDSTHIDHAAYDPAYRFVVDVEPIEPHRLEVETGTDGVVVQERVGRLRLDGLGELDVWWIAGYGGGMFLPAVDASEDTYGGGRYVLDTIKGADLGSDGDRLVVDLNFAYNPSCAYDPEWACPLPQAGNRIEGALPVGEKMPHREDNSR